MSVAGGLWRACRPAAELGCDCIQIFVKNQRQWSAPRLKEPDVVEFRRTAAECRLDPVIAHAGYLINVASPDPATLSRSRRALIDEFERCEQLGLQGLVLHPGAHMGQGTPDGLKRACRTLTAILRQTRGYSTRLLLETTAGQGSCLGSTLSEIGHLLNELADERRVGVCLDTCHLFAAGYNLRTERGYDRLRAELAQHVGQGAVGCIHVNDSAKPCGSRVDRHAHVGRGRIGLAGLARLVRDPSFARVPKILETPKGLTPRGRTWDEVNLGKLRGIFED